MALIKDKKPTAAPGGFEQDDAVKPQQAAAATVAETPAPKVAPVADPVADAGVKATLAVAKASASSLAVQSKMETALANMENAMPPVEFGVLQRLVASQGSFLDSDKKVLGDKVSLTLVSWNRNFVVSPGDDTEAGKKVVAYSRDGVTIDETGENVAAYVERLRTVEGFADAAVKEYCELVGIMTSASKPTEHLNSMVQVSLSPQSRKSFEGYRLQESVKVRLGARSAEGMENLVLTAETKTMGKNTFTAVKFSGG